MGVAGSGKTTIGELLAARLRSTFVDGDAFHPQANIEKMSHGIPLTDADRGPWLAAIHVRIVDALACGEQLVIACSALKQKYRDTLGQGVELTWVYLKGTEELIFARLKARSHHYMKTGMLASQFADLEEPTDAIAVDIADPPDAIVQQILSTISAAA